MSPGRLAMLALALVLVWEPLIHDKGPRCV